MTSGIYLVKTTGKVLKSDPQYLEIYMPSVDDKGKQFMAYTYARPCYSFGDISAPSEKWLQKYKDEIMICIVHEEGNPSIPMWIGYTPLTESITDVPEDFPNGYIKRTEKFFIKIDDKEGKLYIAHREADTLGQCVIIDKNTVTLGNEPATKEPAVLGDTIASILDELITAITLITQPVSGVATTGPLVNLAVFELIKGKLSTIKSKSVKLD